MNPQNPSKTIWFKRKRYGYGWYPSTWQGWAVIGVYVAILAVLGLQLRDPSSPDQVVYQFVVPMLIATVILLVIAYRFGERPRWQWGQHDDDR